MQIQGPVKIIDRARLFAGGTMTQRGRFRAVSIFTLLTAVSAAAPPLDNVMIRPANIPAGGDSGAGLGRHELLLNGRFEITDTVAGMLSRAFDKPQRRIVAPAWASGKQYAIQAQLPSGATSAQIPAMLLALFVERFGLAYHIEMRETPMAALEVAPGGTKLVTATRAGSPIVSLSTAPDGTSFIRIWLTDSAEQLAKEIGYRLTLPVVDRTGLQGTYKFWIDAKFIDPRQTGRDDFAINNFSNALSPFGLRLHLQTLSEEAVVVDHLDSSPTIN